MFNNVDGLLGCPLFTLPRPSMQDHHLGPYLSQPGSLGQVWLLGLQFRSALPNSTGFLQWMSSHSIRLGAEASRKTHAIRTNKHNIKLRILEVGM